MDAVLVTGASMGLGLATALELAARGFRVYGTYLHDPERPEMLARARAAGVDVEPLQLDIRDRGQVNDVVGRAVESAGGLYALVNNAGLSQHGCFEDVSDAEWRALWDVNVFGTLRVTRAALPHLRKAGRGRVVTMSSVAGRLASFSRSGYCSTKFALEGWMDALAGEIGPHGLHAVLIEPGFVETPHWTVHKGVAAGARNSDGPYFALFQRHERLAERLLRRSRIRPTDVARAVHRALTDEPPRRRYVVGRPAAAVTALRQLAPESLFERLYYGSLMRGLTRGVGAPSA